MNTVRKKRIQTYAAYCITTAFAAMVMFSGCSGDDITGAEGHQVAQIVIEPDSAFIEVGEQHDFSAYTLTEDGDTVSTDNLDIEWEWWSTDPDVFTVEPGGLAYAHNPGQEYCIVEVTILKGSSNFTGRDTAIVFVF